MTDYGMKDSGKRQEFGTGAVRDTQEGKGRYDLIPTLFAERLAKVMEKGAVKYGDRNWEKGIPLSRFYDSARRHLDQAFNGDKDEDHLGQCAFNVAGFMWTQNEIECGRLPESLNDLPVPQQYGDRYDYAIQEPGPDDPSIPTDEQYHLMEEYRHENDLPFAEPELERLRRLAGSESIQEHLEAHRTSFGADDTMTISREDMAIPYNDNDTRDNAIKGFDGVMRPRSAPEGTEIIPPLCWGETGEL